MSRSMMGIGTALAIASGHASAAAAQAPSPFTLNVTATDTGIDVALKADNAPLSEIAADLGKRLRANVLVGPSLRQERISVELGASPLESVLTSIAARAFVDYEIRQATRPTPRVIYLLGGDDPDPPMNTNERGEPAVSMGIFISGNTEDVAPAQGEDPLQITGNRRTLSITVKKQPLAEVAPALADVLGVPVDVRYDATELVDLDVREAAPEEVLPRLSPNLSLIVRVNANGADRRLMRIIVDRARER